MTITNNKVQAGIIIGTKIQVGILIPIIMDSRMRHGIPTKMDGTIRSTIKLAIRSMVTMLICGGNSNSNRSMDNNGIQSNKDSKNRINGITKTIVDGDLYFQQSYLLYFRLNS